MRYRKTIGSIKADAERIARQVELELLNGTWGVKQDRQEITFKAMVSKYLEYTKLNKARSTYTGDKYRIEANLIPFFGNILIRNITQELVEKYKSMRVKAGVTHNTVNHELVNLSHILSIAVKWGYLDFNVVSRVDKFKLAKQTPRFLSLEEIDGLLNAARGTYIYPVLVCALHTGMRKSELFNLQWGDVDFGNNAITIQSHDDWHTKNYKARTVQMTPVLAETLAGIYPRGEFVFENGGRQLRYIDKTLQNVLRRAGLTGVTLHTLRHTFASQLVMAGVSLRDVQELMGHQSYETTLKYAHLSKEHVGKQINKLPYGKKQELERKLRVIL